VNQDLFSGEIKYSKTVNKWIIEQFSDSYYFSFSKNNYFRCFLGEVIKKAFGLNFDLKTQFTKKWFT